MPLATPVIEAQDLTFTYPRQPQPTLRALNFSIARGEIFGFLGPSGSGKTTTQKILYKLLSGYQGSVRVEGKALPHWSRSYYEHIGVSFELPNHYLKLSALENLRYFATFYRQPQDPLPLLEAVGLADDAHKRVADFSKGMKMRLNLVRALLHNPPVLFLDEPTSGLDPLNAKRIKDLIVQLRAQGKTIFLTTHNMADADQLCDRVALLSEGEVLALDTPAALRYRYGQRQVRVTCEGSLEPQVFPLEGLGQNALFLQALQCGQLRTIHSEEATLEDAFIAITGKSLL